jgi:hypothetical protein
MSQSTYISGVGGLLAVGHVGLAFVFGGYVIYALDDSYLPSGIQLVLAIGNLAMVWAIFLDRRWALLVQPVLYACSFTLFPNTTPTPATDYVYTGAMLAIGQVLALIPLVIEAVTTIYLVRRLPEPQEQRSKHQRTTIWCVEGAFVVAVAILISIGNFRWPTASFASRLGEGHGERDAQAAQKNEPESEKIRDAIALLKIALENNDETLIETTTNQLSKAASSYFRPNQDDEWSTALTDAGPFVQIHLAKQVIAGKISRERFLITFEKTATDPEVRGQLVIARTRNTVAAMYEETDGNRRKMGALKYRGHARVVTQLATAITDRANTTVEERINLAEAIEETADLDTFDAKPAAEALQAVINSDDDDKVKLAASAALAKALNDKSEK